MDDNTLLQLEGYVESVVYRNEENGYTVVEISDDDDYITAVGIMPRVHQGDLLKLTGNYKEHPNYGRQFSAQVCELCRPSGTAGILRYLSSGAIRGIGATTAQRLVSEFGEKTLDVMENEPERVAMLKGISKSKAEDFSLQLKQSTGIRSRILFLGEYGIGNAAAVKIFTELGTSAIEQIKENPYILCNGEFGISFQTADFIAKKRNFDEQSTERIRAGIAYILIHNEGNGHTCLPFEVLCKKAADFLKVDIALIASTMQEMIFDRSLIKDNVNDKEFIFSSSPSTMSKYSFILFIAENSISSSCSYKGPTVSAACCLSFSVAMAFSTVFSATYFLGETAPTLIGSVLKTAPFDISRHIVIRQAVTSITIFIKFRFLFFSVKDSISFFHFRIN